MCKYGKLSHSRCHHLSLTGDASAKSAHFLLTASISPQMSISALSCHLPGAFRLYCIPGWSTRLYLTVLLGRTGTCRLCLRLWCWRDLGGGITPHRSEAATSETSWHSPRKENWEEAVVAPPRSGCWAVVPCHAQGQCLHPVSFTSNLWIPCLKIFPVKNKKAMDYQPRKLSLWHFLLCKNTLFCSFTCHREFSVTDPHGWGEHPFVPRSQNLPYLWCEWQKCHYKTEFASCVCQVC